MILDLPSLNFTQNELLNEKNKYIYANLCEISNIDDH